MPGWKHFIGILLLSLPPAGNLRAEVPAALTFSCATNNDLYQALGQSRLPRYATPAEAIQSASPGSAVLLLADNYPEQTVYLEPAQFEEVRRKNLRVFLEFPAALPGREVAMPKVAAAERAVVNSAAFAPNLPKNRLLTLNDCHFLPVLGVTNADLVFCASDGFDMAAASDKRYFPILFELPDQGLIVATTKLSDFVSARHAPFRDWAAIWKVILSKLAPGAAPQVDWQPATGPAFGPSAAMPKEIEHQTLLHAAGWLRNSHLLLSRDTARFLSFAAEVGMETAPPADPAEPAGDGSFGLLEGYVGKIFYDGNQFRRLSIRADANAESAMLLSLTGAPADARVARHLLDYVFFDSALCGGPRADPHDPAYGLIGLSVQTPALSDTDASARAILATLTAGAALNSTRWPERALLALAANFRTSGALGFREDQPDPADLEQKGWPAFPHSSVTNLSPQTQSFLWACNLWAFRQSSYPPFLARTRQAITLTMNGYPAQWCFQNNAERARMLVCLAWLARVDNTPEHRQWLNQIAADLLVSQQPSGAIREIPGRAPSATNGLPGYAREPLVKEAGDPLSDQLCLSGFALLGMHEAAAVTGNAAWKQAEDKLAEFLCRTQLRSANRPWLDGIWPRSFDDRNSEAWSGRVGGDWGGNAMEAGLGQAWIPTVLTLRQKNTSLWDYLAKLDLRKPFTQVILRMPKEQ